MATPQGLRGDCPPRRGDRAGPRGEPPALRLKEKRRVKRSAAAAHVPPGGPGGQGGSGGAVPPNMCGER